MRKIFVKMGTGFVGENGYELIEVEDNYSEEKIYDIVYDMAIDWASGYGHCVGVYEDEDDEYSEYSDENLEYSDENLEYSDENLEYYWEDYEPEKHDRYL